MEESDKLREEEQKERRGQGLNPGLPGERPKSNFVKTQDIS